MYRYETNRLDILRPQESLVYSSKVCAPAVSPRSDRSPLPSQLYQYLFRRNYYNYNVLTLVYTQQVFIAVRSYNVQLRLSWNPNLNLLNVTEALLTQRKPCFLQVISRNVTVVDFQTRLVLTMDQSPTSFSLSGTPASHALAYVGYSSAGEASGVPEVDNSQSLQSPSFFEDSLEFVGESAPGAGYDSQSPQPTTFPQGAAVSLGPVASTVSSGSGVQQIGSNPTSTQGWLNTTTTPTVGVGGALFEQPSGTTAADPVDTIRGEVFGSTSGVSPGTKLGGPDPAFVSTFPDQLQSLSPASTKTNERLAELIAMKTQNLLDSRRNAVPGSGISETAPHVVSAREAGRKAALVRLAQVEEQHAQVLQAKAARAALISGAVFGSTAGSAHVPVGTVISEEKSLAEPQGCLPLPMHWKTTTLLLDLLHLPQHSTAC